MSGLRASRIFKIGQLVADKLHNVCWGILFCSHPVEWDFCPWRYSLFCHISITRQCVRVWPLRDLCNSSRGEIELSSLCPTEGVVCGICVRVVFGGEDVSALKHRLSRYCRHWGTAVYYTCHVKSFWSTTVPVQLVLNLFDALTHQAYSPLNCLAIVIKHEENDWQKIIFAWQ